MKIANSLNLKISPTQIKKQVEVSDFHQDIIEATGGLHVLASFPKIQSDQNDKEILKDLDKIVVRGKDNQIPFIKILEKSQQEGCVDTQVLHSIRKPPVLFFSQDCFSITSESRYSFSRQVHDMNGGYSSMYNSSNDEEALKEFAENTKAVTGTNRKMKI